MTSSIVYYPGPWHVGGAESYALNITRALGAFGPVAVISGSRPDDEILEKLRLPHDFAPEWRLARACNQASVNKLARGADIFVNCSAWDYPVPPRDSLSALVAYYTPELRTLSGPTKVARGLAAKVLRRRRLWPAPREAIARYSKILCVSQWTQQLAVERWGRSAEVFYPAVRPVPARPKERVILTVGRIGAGGTRKAHADLIDAFLALDLEGWRLCIAGAVNYEATNAIVETWRRNLKGLEVEIVADPSKEVLEDLYGRASIYWHGAGFGAAPGSIGREHFGISVVEAMSAGAVPVAFEGGGVREIVTRGQDGELWSTANELIEATRRLAHDDETTGRLRRGARARAEYFGIEQHDRRVRDQLVRPKEDQSGQR